jgi:hypothetical protein
MPESEQQMQRLELRRWRRADGSVAATWLVAEGETLAVADDGEAPRPLPAQALTAVFRHYARPLDEGVAASGASVTEHAPLTVQLSSGRARLRPLRIVGFGDVLPNDWLVLEAEGQAPLAAPAALVAEALRALARTVAGV